LNLFLCCHCLEFIDGDLLRCCVCVDRGPGAICGGGSAGERFCCGRFNPEQVSNLFFLFPLSNSHTSCHVCVSEWCNSMWCTPTTPHTSTSTRGNIAQHPVNILCVCVYVCVYVYYFWRCFAEKGFKSEFVWGCVYLLKVNIMELSLINHKHPSNESLLRTRAKVSLTLIHRHTSIGCSSLF